MKKYVYYGKDRNGAMRPVFECVAENDPTPAEVNTIFVQMLAKQGLGAPRPTHYTSIELIEIEQTDEVEADKPLLIHHTDGVVN